MINAHYIDYWLFTIAKTWKQAKNPSAEKWIKKMWYIYIMEYYLAIKNNEIIPSAATWRNLVVILLNEVSHIQKGKYCMISLMCGMEKMIQMSLFTKQKQTHRHRKQIYGYQRGRGQE